MTYEDLLREADREQLIAKEKDLPISKGRIKGNKIAIKRDLTEVEKRCVLAEELGHYYTATADILDQSKVDCRKQERKGRIHAYNTLIGLHGIISCFKRGCRTSYEMAEHLNVTEEFLQSAIDAYRQQYGLYVSVGNYIIGFEPTLYVIEML